MRVYVDTNVWIDFFEGKSASLSFFDAMAACTHGIIISDFVVAEPINQAPKMLTSLRASKR